MTRMKESGIDWIGQIPEEWEVRPIKNIVETPITDGPHETPMLYETGIPFLSAEAVKDGILDFNYKRGYISLRDHERFKKKVSPKKDDIFIVKSGATTGNVGIVTTDEIFDIWSPLALIRSTKTLAIQKYIYFYLLSTLFKAQVEFNWSFGTQQNIGMGVIERIKVILPPVSEQERIVEILDKKTAQLDKVKALLEEQIQKLKDYRASLVYETITKGLDKTVPMKDSGIDWIGQVPEGWEISKIKFTTQLNGRIGWQGLTSAEYKEEGPYLITGTDFHNGTINFETAVHIDEKRWSEASQIQVENGDLLITKDGTVGKVAIISGLDDKASLNSGVLRIQTIDEIDRRFLYYILLSDEFWMWFNYTNSGASTILHLYQNVFDEFTFTFPQKNEQTKISDLLDKKTVQIDKLIQIKNEQIKNINKQRQTLIYDYVTGKRRV